MVFCPEFLADRWSFQPYTDGLRELGFDLFTFDFRNHGTSASEAGYVPLQWVSDRDLRDLRAALGTLREVERYEAIPATALRRGGVRCCPIEPPTRYPLPKGR